MLGGLLLVVQDRVPRIGPAPVDRALHRERTDRPVLYPHEAFGREHGETVFVEQSVRRLRVHENIPQRQVRLDFGGERQVQEERVPRAHLVLHDIERRAVMLEAHRVRDKAVSRGFGVMHRPVISPPVHGIEYPARVDIRERDHDRVRPVEIGDEQEGYPVPAETVHSIEHTAPRSGKMITISPAFRNFRAREIYHP